MSREDKQLDENNRQKQDIAGIFILAIGMIQIIISLIFYPDKTSILIGSLFGIVLVYIGIIAALYDEEMDSEREHRKDL